MTTTLQPMDLTADALGRRVTVLSETEQDIIRGELRAFEHSAVRTASNEAARVETILTIELFGIGVQIKVAPGDKVNMS
jgi:hypothetical protein